MGKYFKDTNLKPENSSDLKPQTEAREESVFKEDSKETFLSEYTKELNKILEQKEYHHWNTKAEQEENRKLIKDYDIKKRAVDKASLQTQYSILTKYGEFYNRENRARICNDLDSNKTEIYNEPYFVVEKIPVDVNYRILGTRDIADGKICIRDTDDINGLKHISTHETMHDLSFQHKENKERTELTSGKEEAKFKRTYLTSGIHKVEKEEKNLGDKTSITDIKHENRFLNEGLTELYTIEEMKDRGETPPFDCYSQEVGWAINLREAVGDETIAEAYFGGNLEALERKVNDMSAVPNAWFELNRNIDAYHCTNNLVYKDAADSILADLQGSRVLVKRRALR